MPSMPAQAVESFGFQSQDEGPYGGQYGCQDSLLSLPIHIPVVVVEGSGLVLGCSATHSLALLILLPSVQELFLRLAHSCR